MFSFHKGEALPRSRQSSVDSQGFTSHVMSSAYDSEPAVAAADPYAAMHGPNHPTAYSARRNSVFKMRSRSNTATSTTPSLFSITHSEMPEPEVRWQGAARVPQSGGQFQGDMAKGAARRSFFRGRKGKRNSEAAAPSIPDCAETELSHWRSSVLRRDRRLTESGDPGESSLSSSTASRANHLQLPPSSTRSPSRLIFNTCLMPIVISLLRSRRHLPKVLTPVHKLYASRDRKAEA